mgnify:CR=1 FL=1
MIFRYHTKLILNKVYLFLLNHTNVRQELAVLDLQSLQGFVVTVYT